MRLSEICAVNTEARLRRKCDTLTASILRRWEYHRKHQREQLSPAHEGAANAVIRTLDALKHSEINTLKSSREMKQSAKEVLSEIFIGLPEPRPANLNAVEKALCENMTEIGRNTRAAMFKTAVVHQSAWSAKQQHYMIFNTLTVAPGHMLKVFAENSKAFKNYIARVNRRCGKHHYAAVVEEGSKTGRLHIHVIHFLEKLPKNARDPNTGLAIPNRRELGALKALWDHGYSSPKIIRYSPTDAWGRAAYRWPIDPETGAPLRIRSPVATSLYLAKYINKAHSSKQRETYKWRTRKTHGLGKQILEELLSTLTPHQLHDIASANAMTAKLNYLTIPTKLLRMTALRLLNQSANVTQNPYNDLAATASSTKPRQSPLQSLRGSNRTDDTCNPQKPTPSTAHDTNETDTFNETAAALRAAASSAHRQYFERPRNGYGSHTTSDLHKVAR
ncbi:replication associated protein [Microviridae sp.]|nr:replication associated protein [Microviridae sp.]